jgi:hypothetical protein
MVVLEFRSLWARWRIRPSESYFVPSPQLEGYPRNIPSALEPGKQWVGHIQERPDTTADLRSGQHYLGVYASHRERPYLIVIPKKKDKLPEGTKPLEQ